MRYKNFALIKNISKTFAQQLTQSVVLIIRKSMNKNINNKKYEQLLSTDPVVFCRIYIYLASGIIRDQQTTFFLPNNAFLVILEAFIGFIWLRSAPQSSALHWIKTKVFLIPPWQISATNIWWNLQVVVGHWFDSPGPRYRALTHQTRDCSFIVLVVDVCWWCFSADKLTHWIHRVNTVDKVSFPHVDSNLKQERRYFDMMTFASWSLWALQKKNVSVFEMI